MNPIIILLLATSLLVCPGEPLMEWDCLECQTVWVASRTICPVCWLPSCVPDTASTDTTWYVVKVRKYLKQLDAGEIDVIDFGGYLLQVGMLMEMRDTLANMVRCAELEHAIETDPLKRMDTPNNRYWKQELRKLKRSR